MSQSYRDELDRLLSGKKDTFPENEQSKERQSPEDQSIFYYEDGRYSMFISFVELSKKRFFLNYGNLKSGKYDPVTQSIKLIFAENTVELKGHALENLYYQLMANEVKEIFQQDKRYEALQGNTPIVYAIKTY